MRPKISKYETFRRKERTNRFKKHKVIMFKTLDDAKTFLYSRIHVHDGETKNESFLPIILSILAVATIMGVTFGMLYWNYCEQQNGDLNIQNI